jgi:hypothetical protein
VVAAVEFMLLAQAGLTLVMVALFLALALNPAVEFAQRRGLGRASAVGAVYVVALAILTLLGAVFIPPLVDQISKLIDALPSLVDDLTKGHGPLGFLERKYQVVERVRSATTGQSANGLLGLADRQVEAPPPPARVLRGRRREDRGGGTSRSGVKTEACRRAGQPLRGAADSLRCERHPAGRGSSRRSELDSASSLCTALGRGARGLRHFPPSAAGDDCGHRGKDGAREREPAVTIPARTGACPRRGWGASRRLAGLAVVRPRDVFLKAFNSSRGPVRADPEHGGETNK